MTCRTGLLSLATAFALAALGTASANAQEWPTRSVRFLVPYGPGGGTDNVSRIIAQQLQEKLGQSFVVETNDPGQIVVISDDPARPGTMTVEVGEPSDFGIELDQEVWEDRERVEGLAGGEYLGGNKLMSQLGEAFYSRSRMEEDGAVVETVRVFALHPTENRLVTLSYRYPAADDSSERLPEVLELLGAIEITDDASG